MRSSRPYTIVTTLIVALVALLPVVSSAQETPTTDSNSSVMISIGPKGLPDGARFEAEVAPGESTEITAALQNHGSEPIGLRTYKSDIVPMANGGMKMADRETAPTGPATWLTYESEELTLNAGEVIDRPLTITVPEGTPPGEYVSAVALETLEPVNEGQGGAFEQYFRKVVAVYVTVPGDLNADFELGEPEVLVISGRSGVVIPITNTGNIRLDLIGEVTLTDLDGNIVHQGELQLGPIYMGQETTIQIAFASVPPVGDYTLSYSFTDSASEVTKSTDDGGLAVEVPEDSQPMEVAAFSFENVVVEPNDDPIVFANVSLDINVAAAHRSTKLTMSVFRDGELVEDFVLAENLSLEQGATTVTQRYLPATNWESGTYTFSLKLESTESGSTSLLYEQKDVATLEVP